MRGPSALAPIAVWLGVAPLITQTPRAFHTPPGPSAVRFPDAIRFMPTRVRAGTDTLGPLAPTPSGAQSLPRPRREKDSSRVSSRTSFGKTRVHSLDLGGTTVDE